MTVDERIMKHDNLASFIPITTIIATITRTIVDAAIIEMYPRAFIKTFQPGTVLMQAMKSPQLPKKWAVHEFHDKKLCGLVLEAFRKAGLEPADFEEAIHSAREQVYKASRNNFLQAIGIPYGQWKAMEIACELLDVKASASVHNFEFEDQSFHMEGLSLDSWCLYKVEASTAAAGLKKPVAATAPAGGSNKSTAAAVAAPAGGSKKPAAAAGSKKSTAAAAAPAGGSKKPDAATTSATGSKKPITATAPAGGSKKPAAAATAPAGGSNKSAAAAATTTTTTSAAGAKKPAKAKAGLAGSRWALGGSSRSPPPKAPSPPPEIPLRDLGKSSWAPGGPSRDRKGWGKGKGKGKAE